MKHTPSMTLDIMIFIVDFNAEHCIYDGRTTNDYGFSVWIETDKKIQVYGGTGVNVKGNTVLQTNKYYHLTVVCDNSATYKTII